MIRSFRHRGLQRFYETGSKASIQPKHAAKLRLQLGALNRAKAPRDMDVPGWRLHPLTGPLTGHWSVWVDQNWRMTFMFKNGDTELVDYQDYH